MRDLLRQYLELSDTEVEDFIAIFEADWKQRLAEVGVNEKILTELLGEIKRPERV